jgi:predicted chitinase
VQAASRLIVKHGSEWANPAKWTKLIAELDQRTGTKPQREEELKRIGKLAWWDEVKARVPGFPEPDVFHIHPIGLAANFALPPQLACTHCGVNLTITSEILGSIFPQINSNSANGFAQELTSAFTKYGINTCRRVAHFLGQCSVECAGFTAFRESLWYTDGDRLWITYKSALSIGLKRLHPDWSSSQIEQYAKAHLIRNDSDLGIVLFGTNAYPSVDYRGRGLLHLTWHENYERYKTWSGIDVVSDPSKVESDWHVAADSSAWYWSMRAIGPCADTNDVKEVTRKINPALKDLERRRNATKRAFHVINQGGLPCRSEWDSTLNGEHGW